MVKPLYRRLRAQLIRISTSPYAYLSRSDKDAIAHAERIIAKLVDDKEEVL